MSIDLSQDSGSVVGQAGAPQAKSARVPDAFTKMETYAFRCQIDTRFGDQDINRHINNVSMGSFFEEGRIRFKAALGMAALQPGGTIAASIRTDFIRDALYPGFLEIGVAVLRIGTTSWTLVEAAFQARRCVAVCQATLVLRNADGPFAMTAEWRAALAAHTVVAPDA